MDRLERLYRIHSLLRSRRLVTTRQFLDDLEISRATFKRDLDVLRDRLRAPIVYDHQQEAYRYDDTVADSALWQLPGLWFTADELRALLTMDQLLADLQPGVLSELIGPIRSRLRELMESGEHSVEEVARRIRVLTMGARAVEPANFRVLSTALLSRRRLHLRHLRRQTGEMSERDVSPQRLVHYRDNWYLDAWCHRKQALHTFAVDAIEQATVLEQAALDVKDETLDRHLTSGYGIFAGVHTQEAVLLFNATRARWVATEVWHPQQDGKLQLDGGYLLRLPYSREPELVMDILKYGADVEVLSPESLRTAVANQLRDAARLYEHKR